MNRNITFKISDELLTVLDAYAERHKLYRSEVIRIAIEKLIIDEFKKENISKASIEKMEL